MTAIKKMQAGRETKMLRGAMWACAIPIIFGFGFVYLVVDIAWGYQRSFPLILSISPAAYPALCLFILSPLTAWLSCGWLRRIDDPAKLSQWRISFVTALVIATGLQLIMTLGYGLFLDYQFKAIFGSASDSLAASCRCNRRCVPASRSAPRGPNRCHRQVPRTRGSVPRSLRSGRSSEVHGKL